MRRHPRFGRARVGVLALGAWLAGCAVGPDYRRPELALPNRYGITPPPRVTARAATLGGERQTLAVGADVAGDWWDLFRSPALSGLVVAALAANPGVDAARAALRNAEELGLASYAPLLPQVAGTFSKQAGQIPLAEDGTNPGTLGQNQLESVPYRFYNAQVSFNYDFDVWGGTRRAIEQRRALSDYQRSYLEATDLTLTGNVVSAAITMAATLRQIALQRELIGFEQRYLATLQVRFADGAVDGTDVALQQNQVAVQQALLPPLETTLAQTEHLLAAYLGGFPATTVLPKLALDALALPPTLPLPLPASLLDHRPDVAEAEAQLHAATAAIGVAVANRLPQVSLATILGSDGIGAQDLFTGGSGASSLILQAMQPIFMGGQLLHAQRAAEATAAQDAALWRQTVVGAVQNVADVLTALREDADLLGDDLAAEEAAKRALDLAQMQYRLGGIALLTVLQSEIAYETALIALVRAQAARFSDSAALFVAVGGGWWHRQDLPPAPPGVLPSLLPWRAS